MKSAKLLKLLYVQVLIGLVLGIAVGHWWPEFGAALKPLGDGFVKLVKMMIAPIVFCTIVSGITSLNDSKQIGKTLLKSMGLFYALTILALLTGLASVFLLQPGAGMHIDPKHLDAAVAGKYASQIPPRGFTEFVLHIIPNSFFGAFADGEVLPVLLLSVLCGFGLTRIGTAGRVVLEGIDGFANMLFAAFGFIMRLAPLGAFGAMAFTVGRYGIKSIGSLGMLIGTFYVACIFFVVVVLGTLAWLHKFKLWQLLRYIREELLVVLGTSSSEPVLPRLLMKLERLGCKKGVVGLVLPTGYSFNLDGSTLYLAVAAMFAAQAAGVHMTFGHQLLMMLTLMLTSKGVAAVPRASLVILAGTLQQFGLPLEAVAIILGVDELMDMARTTVNLVGNCLATVVMARWEGEFVEAPTEPLLVPELSQSA